MSPSKVHPPATLARPSRRPKLGEMLVSLGYLRANQVEACISHQRQWGVSFGRVAIARGFCTEPQVLHALSEQLGLESVDLDAVHINPMAAERLPMEAAVRLHAIPFHVEGPRHEVLHVAFAAPAALDVQDQVRALTGKARVMAFLAGDDAVERAIGRFYRREDPRHAPAAPIREFDLNLADDDVSAAATVKVALELSSGAMGVVRQAALDNGVSAETVMVRVLEAWAAPFVKK